MTIKSRRVPIFTRNWNDCQALCLSEVMDGRNLECPQIHFGYWMFIYRTDCQQFLPIRQWRSLLLVIEYVCKYKSK